MTTNSTAEDVCYAYTRSNGKSEAYVFINFHYNPIVVSTADINLNILSSGYSVESNANQVLKNNTITLAPHSYIIYYK
jgi:hypothetical protein